MRILPVEIVIYFPVRRNAMETIKDNTPIYSHNPCHSTKFPLLVLDVSKKVCKPFNEGFQMLQCSASYFRKTGLQLSQLSDPA